MPDDPQYNEAYIRAKEQQAEKHVEGHAVKAGRDRLPPGQTLIKGFPILERGVRPFRANYSRWSLEIFGKVENPRTLSLAELKALGGKGITADFHCVTRWSRYDLNWRGIPFPKIIELVKPNPNAVFVSFHSYDKYTTNVPVGELLKLIVPSPAVVSTMIL